MKNLYALALTAALAILGAAQQQAQAQAPAAAPKAAPQAAAGPPPRPPYGTPITLAQARLVAAAVIEEGKKHNLMVTVAVVEPSGALVYYERNDGSTYAAEDLAILKAKGAARYGHGGDSWKQQLDSGRLDPLLLPGPVFQYHGSEIIVVNGKIIGAVGATGGFDSELAKAGAGALK